MFMRISTYRVKESSISQFEQIGESARDKMAAINGMQRVVAGVDESGNAAVVGFWDSEESATRAQSQVRAAWESISEHIAEQPRITEYRNAYVLKG